MDPKQPALPSDEIDLYVHTYSSLLRSSGEVRVRAFEEAHAFCASSLHEGALSPIPDVSAFAYAAARLPDEAPQIEHVVLGQSHEVFEAAGFDVRQWSTVKTRGRRRPLRYDGAGTLAVFIASQSDIDDLIPILTAYQIEWNKMHARLRALGVDAPEEAARSGSAEGGPPVDEEVAELLGVDVPTVAKLIEAFGNRHYRAGLKALAEHPLDLHVRMLAPSYSQYQRAAARWWSGIEPAYVRSRPPRRPPVYFVSSNTHAMANLVGGFARANAQQIVEYAQRRNPEGLASTVADVASRGREDDLLPFLFYLLRGYIHEQPESRMAEVRRFEAQTGLAHLSGPGHIDVDAQIVELARLDPERIDPRLRVPGIERIAKSDAYVLNIDYPLGMAAYHHLSRVGQAVGELRGIYVMGKAATLNGRVGDVALSGSVYDEHSGNTFLFKNAFTARDVRPFLRYGSVFDNQGALTVRSAFLQNKNYMSAYYREGYTVLEMEAGPFLSAAYELVFPSPSPAGEIVHLSAATPFDVGILHYASDTPYSRKQSLLSKSLSYFGVDSTYACAIAILRRILEHEVARNP